MTGVEIMLIAGTALSAVGALQSASAQASAAKYNAKVAENNAVAARQQAAADAERQRRLAAKTIGTMRAGYGASGVSLEGSPLDILEQSAADAELDVQTTLWKGETAARGYSNNATLDRSQAKSSQTAGYLNAGSAILLGGSQAIGAGKDPTGLG